MPRGSQGAARHFASEQTLHQNDGDQDRQNVFKVGLDPLRHFGAAACVALGGVFVKAPAPFGDTEQQINKAAARQQNVADKEVLKIQHGAARAQGLDAAPHVVAQRAGQAQHDQCRCAHQASPAAVPAEIFPRTGDDVLKHRNDRGKAGERHEQEEQRAPQASARHVCKDVGQRDENQARSRVGRDAEGEAGREDDKARADRHKGIQHADAGGLTRQGETAVHVAAENLNCADAEA